MASLTQQKYSILLVFEMKESIDYQTFKKLHKHRFNNAYTNGFREWRGPDTDQAREVASEIVTHFNQRKHES